ncbi:MAG: alpha/beta fold hydrolase [Planctomycetota bacterium]
MATEEGRPRRLRRISRVLLCGCLAYLLLVLLGLPFSFPFDLALNLGSFPSRPDLRAPRDGRSRLVVLQHGLWRSSWSLWKLERSLEQHGYEVLNESYPSTSGTIEQHADRLASALAARIAGHGAYDEISFVGHSLGGLVIAEYLRRRDAVRPKACVFLASPLRGAVLAELRSRWWPFALLMGDEAALQLRPGDPIHAKALVLPATCGAIVGNLGAGNPAIPGDDDGTVAVSEARFGGESDSIELPLGHTRITCDDRSIEQVLAFLRYGRFARR